MNPGAFNKKIAIQFLLKKKDEFGSENEEWITVVQLRANVTGFDRNSLFTQSNEVLVSERLLFAVPLYAGKKLRRHDSINYRIAYLTSPCSPCNRVRHYRVLNINYELKDRVSLLAELINT